MFGEQNNVKNAFTHSSSVNAEERMSSAGPVVLVLFPWLAPVDGSKTLVLFVLRSLVVHDALEINAITSSLSGGVLHNCHRL